MSRCRLLGCATAASSSWSDSSSVSVCWLERDLPLPCDEDDEEAVALLREVELLDDDDDDVVVVAVGCDALARFEPTSGSAA